MFIISILLLATTRAQDTPTLSPTASPTGVDFNFNETDLIDCGNGVCDPGENCLSCPVDCISGTAGGFQCGNGICEDGETCYTCPGDCNGTGEDFCCYGGRQSPGLDNASSCKDMRCGGEGVGCTIEDSPLETYCCGDNTCSGEETSLNCAIDQCKQLCGNNVCDESEGENADTCPMDCTCNMDGKCDSWETTNSCPLDCTCGNRVCDVELGENVANCMNDCACNANYNCEAWEDKEHCPRDCGVKAEYDGNGHDASDGLDGTDQQSDGSNYDDEEGLTDMNDDGGSGGLSESCFDNDISCGQHSECCSYACDSTEKKCVG